MQIERKANSFLEVLHCKKIVECVKEWTFILLSVKALSLKETALLIKKKGI